MLKPTKLAFINGRPTLISYDKIAHKDNDKTYNFHRNVEESDYVKFYHSTEWKHKRQEILERDYGLCQRCGMDAELVNHIIPNKDDWIDRLNDDSLQPLCRGCHKTKTKREWMKHHKGPERYMNINIVCGLPASGKTTYVKQHMTEYDLIYDYDELMQALTGLPLHQTNYDVYDYVSLFFDQMLRKLKTKQAFNNVWIIKTLPDKWIDTLLSNYRRINHIVIMTDPNVCEERLREREERISFQKILSGSKTADFTGYRVVKNG